MPYIKQESRKLARTYPNTSGELNYAFTSTITEYIQHKGLNYQTINDIIGALEGAKLEVYRRIAIPYENKKMKENGDVYDENC